MLTIWLAWIQCRAGALEGKLPFGWRGYSAERVAGMVLLSGCA